MTHNQILLALGVWSVLMVVCYTHSGWRNMRDCYAMWFSREYWTSYNTVEFVSWWAKAFIIVPGLVFGIQIWQLYYLTLATSVALVWASHKKALPTLVGFNTMWAWLSCMVLAQHWIK
jgi:hypothetical protein